MSQSSFLSALLLVSVVVVLAHGARRTQLSSELEAAVDDRVSTTDPGPPRRFHAIFHAAASSSTAVDFKSSPSVVEKMMAAGRGTVDNNNGNKNRSTSSTRQCREGCLEKRSIKDILCTNQRECAMCWDVCNRNHQIRKENELAHRLLLSLSRMIRNESVVTADIEWTTPEELLEHQPHPVVPSPLAASENVERLSRIARDGGANSSVSRIIQALSQSAALGSETKSMGTSTSEQSFHQCLVSWEISGGGLTGNLLTETAKVELSLWPNTKYHVHVTCRNKETDQLIRSAPLLIDTSEAVIVSLQGTTTTTSTTTTTTTIRPLSINSVIEEIDVIQEASSFTDGDPISPLQTLQQKQDRHPSRPHLWPIYSAELPENSKEIVILGVFVAILAFVLIVLTVVILVRRKQDAIEDRELLIESEVLPKILHV